ncbi:1,4-dihydroxy-2-naphthoate polyprenyltransferase [Enterococcus saccharolyticus]|uniref:UbiA family prenyltransferase n=1 Tax=Enterococcus saccharolyticus subsp. saccharolyticus ATCC 43076 TaxID=1139996 RepID=S0NTP3_9ENTE|nr:1,4-dihydroxy-2-naphthoate polyprenyltransferase [Enterococcus saccharolyticus]EOT30382.1 UbiA family prenyltransferase [Enterococcus saccharolyticus subsp. saccharolyticus ATCC 43076]EOT79943.1 UbiA family prenyltransferase [Enterococcus saccharolyticus subsp. saccharolyticus ATCC 43076]
MSLKNFLEVVEIRTKVASLFPFLIGVLYSLARFNEFHGFYTVLFFIGMITFDMTTTAINNYMDFKKAQSQTYKYEQNVIGRERISPALVRKMILVMMGISAVIGLLLSLMTGWLFLIMGGLVCLVGIFYTFGPIPVSRMPLGELASGLTMGLGLFAMTVYLNTVNQRVFYLDISFKNDSFSLGGQLWGILAIFVASLPLVFTIANIMLANNLRDLETDVENNRYTLVYYIGRKKGVQLFQVLMYGCYGAILLGFLFWVFRWPILIVFISLPKVRRNLMEFKETLPNPNSFNYAIQNMVLFNASYAFALLVSLLF